MNYKKKLIEVALPLDAINKASAREKSIRHGHPSTLHLWWARRPLAAARAVIFSQMVDDPSGYTETLLSDPNKKRAATRELGKRKSIWEIRKTQYEEAQRQGDASIFAPGPEPTLDECIADIERERLFRIIEDLVLWENTTNEKVLQQARDEIWQSWRRTCAENADHPRATELFDRHKLPAFHDPFAGGGSLPLEAQRLGLEAYASDLNPVAVLINKAMIEIPPKFAGRPPVNPESNPGSAGVSPVKGWYSRRYLPHVDLPGLLQAITFRLDDSLPKEVFERLAQDAVDDAVERKRIEAVLNAGHGECWLQRHEIAEIVENALFHFDGQRYRLIAWCVMPNHVHVLIEAWERWPLAGVIQSWKSFTAKAINRNLGRGGEVWQREYFDRYIRDDRHLQATIEYIENNPVAAGLAPSPESWQFSSASQRKKKAGGTPALPGIREWKGAQGLAEDVRYYGKWMRDEAEKRIGHLYPKIEVTAEMVAGSAGVSPARPDLKPYMGRKLTVIAWLWARTVKSPNPAFANVDVPLASTFMLSTKAGKEAYIEPIITPSPLAGEGGGGGEPGYRFTVKVGKPKDAEAAKNGTKLTRANFLCLMSGAPISGDYIKAEGKVGRMGARLMAIVAEDVRGRVYLSPTEVMEAVALKAKPEWKPDVVISGSTQYLGVKPYGMEQFSQLFTNRQLVALTTFSDLVQEAREQVKRSAMTAGLPDDGKLLDAGGNGATAYADAVGTYLAFAVDKGANYWSAVCAWHTGAEKMVSTFGRQAIPMVWDYTEANPFSDSSGNVLLGIEQASKMIQALGIGVAGAASQADAANQSTSANKVVSTDPPYFDNVPYADLSDFFYVWLRRSLKPVFPNLFATVAVPKAEELVAFAYRHDGKTGAEAFFLGGMTQAMHCLAEQVHPAFPVTIYYAFRQSETDSEAGTASTGWDTFLYAVIRAGFGISGTWPMRTEYTGNLKTKRNALASSIILVCRKRAADAPTITRREFVTALKIELPLALAHLQRGNIAPVDLAQAAIGPGMAIYTRYARVLDAEGKPLTVREALALINQTLDEALAEQEGDFDADSRWALTWFEQSGFAEGEYGMAEQLSKSKNTSVAGMVEAGILASSHGKVRLLQPNELPADWDPTADKRLTAWEGVHHLIRALESGGEGAAAVLVAKLGVKAEIARELAYRLYTLCERKKRAAEALSYNGLVQSWPEITRLSREGDKPRPATPTLFDEIEE